jgi:PAS domain S-box-containing protein
MPQLAWIARADGHIIWYNQRWYDYTGTVPEQMEGWGWQSVHDPKVLPKVLARWRSSIATGEPFNMTFPLRGADGVFRPFLTLVIPLKDAAGSVQQWFGSNTDISRLKHIEERLKASLAEKEVLLKEVHHRVKNNLQVISSLVSLQADTLADARVLEVLGDVRNRVMTMALVHEKLYQTDDLAQLNFTEYAEGILRHLWNAYSAETRNIHLNLSFAPMVMPVETAVPCGLILNELVSNAIKHAFPGISGGEVSVTLEHDPATGTSCLRVRDNGAGLPADLDWRQSGSLGLRLVQMLAGQMHGVVQAVSGSGTEFQITFHP